MKKKNMKTDYTIKDIEDFVHEHIQEEIDMGVLMAKGFSIDVDKFKNEFTMYRRGLTEGVINGIHMMGGDVIDLEEIDVNEL